MTGLQILSENLMHGVAMGAFGDAIRAFASDGNSITFTPSCCGFTQAAPLDGSTFFCKCGRQFSVSRK